MSDDLWKRRWREGRIGFHEGRPNAFLERHVGVFGAARRVLVPLCGKSEDLAFLASQGHTVTGVELVRDAAEAFFREHGLEPRIARHGAFERFEAGHIAILVGDVFALEADVTGPIDALYDRAALIALPEDLRARYVPCIRPVLQPGAVGLVVTLEYPQERHPGPPYSVPESELRAHYRGFDVALLEEQPWSSSGPSAEAVAGRQCCFRISGT